MINKKICMLGAFSVGKTSLVSQYVHSVFSDKYLSTVGVKISKKMLVRNGQEISLVLWDMEGKDIYADINTSYLRGAMGFFVVADGMRRETLEIALSLRETVFTLLGPTPHRLLINKADMQDKWEITPAMVDTLHESGVPLLLTSAKTGMAVEEAFIELTDEMMRRR
ncbi:GTP-binding protein [Desulfovibrio sp. OttesenSCG-928-A18]|nr:GTP-binding protein [Desulfovibrio sp. OttesenSCG-928-A18]